MTKITTIAYGASAIFHVGLLAGLAVCASSASPVQIHMQQGASAVIQGNFLTAEALSTMRFEIRLPTPFASEVSEIAPSDPEPAPTLMSRASVPLEMLVARADLPMPLTADEPLERVTLVEPMQKPSQATTEAPPLSSTVEAPIQSLPRSYQVASFSVATEVVLPSGGGATGGGVDELPRRVGSNRPPPYPPDAFQRGQQGRVILEVHVSAQGRVAAIRIIESSGVDSLDTSALEAVTDWRFEPARQGGLAVAAVVNVPIRFAIRS